MRIGIKLKPCKICNNLTSLYRSGVACCNGCRLFVGRILRKRNSSALEPCLKGGRCSTSVIIDGCKSCRLQKCQFFNIDQGRVKSQMVEELLDQYNNQNEKFLNKRPSRQYEITLSWAIKNDIDPDLVGRNAVIFKDWCLMSQICAIDFLKELPVFSRLIPEDKELFVRKNRYKTSFLCLAMISYKMGFRALRYPNTMDIFPDEIASNRYIRPELIQRTRVNLVEKLSELKVTSEEFVIYLCILILTDIPEEMKPHGTAWLNGYHGIYMDLLNYHCNCDPKDNPTRILELGSIAETVNQTLQDYESVYYFHEYTMFVNGLRIGYPNKDSLLCFGS
ncbi:hypothetical protein CAEBREN_05875 [Caenorhabditis brenneri]|uniref:Uncharacterized protein n=1 Tax=Caenorhabditis brenneri TaxID=135651 RepID=G0NWB0_CAEBE|nr:hypothetical protein CAEBREN_05875 [Caenorhabditis brenneri]